MPVLEKECQTAPRSALRYRPIDTGQALADQAPTRARKSRPDARVTTAPAAPDNLDLEWKHVPRRHSVAPVQPARRRRQFHPLFFVGIGLLTTLLLWVGVTQVMIWGTNEYNTITYGYPRTFQTDAVVGQGDSSHHPSHFLAINLHGFVTIFDFPAGDPTHGRQLMSSQVLGSNADLTVVTLRFIDFNHNGYPAMLINANGIQTILVNDGKTFRQPTPAEQQQMLQELQKTTS